MVPGAGARAIGSFPGCRPGRHGSAGRGRVAKCGLGESRDVAHRAHPECGAQLTGLAAKDHTRASGASPTTKTGGAAAAAAPPA